MSKSLGTLRNFPVSYFPFGKCQSRETKIIDEDFQSMLFDLGRKGFGDVRQLHTHVHPSGSLCAYQPRLGLYLSTVKPFI